MSLLLAVLFAGCCCCCCAAAAAAPSLFRHCVGRCCLLLLLPLPLLLLFLFSRHFFYKEDSEKKTLFIQYYIILKKRNLTYSKVPSNCLFFYFKIFDIRFVLVSPLLSFLSLFIPVLRLLFFVAGFVLINTGRHLVQLFLGADRNVPIRRTGRRQESDSGGSRPLHRT